MKFGIRTPSIKGRISARTSPKRMVRAKIRMPRGYGFVTNPKKAAYNRVYNRTTISVDKLAKNALPNNKALTASTGHGTFWWLFIGWWWWVAKLEIKIILWIAKKLLSLIRSSSQTPTPEN